MLHNTPFSGLNQAVSSSASARPYRARLKIHPSIRSSNLEDPKTFLANIKTRPRKREESKKWAVKLKIANLKITVPKSHPRIEQSSSRKDDHRTYHRVGKPTPNDAAPRDHNPRVQKRTPETTHHSPPQKHATNSKIKSPRAKPSHALRQHSPPHTRCAPTDSFSSGSMRKRNPNSLHPV